VRKWLALGTVIVLVACNALLGNDPFRVGASDAGVDAREDVAEEHDVPPASCGDTRTDPLHCGRCNHSCRGGGCKAGQCEPVQLLSGLDRPGYCFVLRDRYLYFGERNTLVRANADGTDKRVLATSVDPPSECIVDGLHLYWTTMNPTIHRVTVDGAQVGPVATGQYDLSTLDGDEGAIYWVGTSDFQGTSFSVYRYEKKDGGLTPLVSNIGRASSLLTRYPYVYWQEGEVVRRTSTSGGNPLPVGSWAEYKPTRVVQDATHLYGVGSRLVGTSLPELKPVGFLVRMSKETGERQVLYDGQDGEVMFNAVAVDAGGVYWANLDGAMYHAAKDGAARRLLASDAAALAITTDDLHIYYLRMKRIDGGFAPGEVYRLAK
jgi:hypothetical protein